MTNYAFTKTIKDILNQDFGDYASHVYQQSLLIHYLNIKTRSANTGSKSRGSFANIYALYILIEDYINNKFADENNNISYNEYEGAKYTELFNRQRSLPFGQKLQNHALNHRLNEEFTRYFPGSEQIPILRDLKTRRYWINERLLVISLGGARTVNIAKSIIKIIDAYIDAKRIAFELFIQSCQQIEKISHDKPHEAIDFIKSQIQPNIDARIFEIISFAILKAHYSDQSIFWGFSPENVREDFLVLYKTGRTNANDGGIDFVMRPLGRFFQVTETVDVKKYFLDIDKLQRFPVTFVVKSDAKPDDIRLDIRSQAERIYGIKSIIERYMESIEEIINTSDLIEKFQQIIKVGKLHLVMEEIITQSRVEFNYKDDESEDTESEEEAL